jgi:uncharacterized protein (TIGR00661 family)
LKILYAIQGTGNGHLSRAREIIPHLLQHGELDVLVSGKHGEISLPQKPKFELDGLGYFFGKNGGIDYWRSVKALRLFRLQKDVRTFPVEKYDLVINDFEPITAWACKLKNVPCVGLSHQSAFLSSKTPRPPKTKPFAEIILKHYAPVNYAVGIHFQAYDDFIHTPIIRSEVRALTPTNAGHITVYLPSVDHKKLLNLFAEVGGEWHVFSKHISEKETHGKIKILPISNDVFLDSLASTDGFLSNAGFEGPSEAMFLGKKTALIPMAAQYEQACNAVASQKLGAETGDYSKILNPIFLSQWVRLSPPARHFFPDNAQELCGKALNFNG